MTEYTGNLHPQDTPSDIIHPNIVGENVPAEAIDSSKLTQQAQGHFNTLWMRNFSAININTASEQVELSVSTNCNVISSAGVSNNTGKSGNYSFANANTFLWVFAYDLTEKDYRIIDFDAEAEEFGENVYPIFGYSNNMGGRITFFAGINPQLITIDGDPLFVEKLTPELVNANILNNSIYSSKLTQQAQGHFNTLWMRNFSAININTASEQVELSVSTNCNVISSAGVSNNTGKSGNYSFANANTFLWVFAYDLTEKDYRIIDFDAEAEEFGENVYPIFGYSNNMGGRITFFAGINPQLITINGDPLFLTSSDAVLDEVSDEVFPCGTVTFLGDSFTTFRGYITEGNATWYPREASNVKQVRQTWWRQFAAENGLRILENNSYSGSFVSNSDVTGLSSQSFLKRAELLSGSPDLIVVLGGTNDVWNAVPVGDVIYDDFTAEALETFTPALSKLFSDLIARFPNSDILYIAPPAVSGDYLQNAITVCEHYGIFIISIKEGMSTMSDHPDKLGMWQINTTIMDEIYKAGRL